MLYFSMGCFTSFLVENKFIALPFSFHNQEFVNSTDSILIQVSTMEDIITDLEVMNHLANADLSYNLFRYTANQNRRLKRVSQPA
jgi:hypothetical protein